MDGLSNDRNSVQLYRVLEDLAPNILKYAHAIVSHHLNAKIPLRRSVLPVVPVQ